VRCTAFLLTNVNRYCFRFEHYSYEKCDAPLSQAEKKIDDKDLSN